MPIHHLEPAALPATLPLDPAPHRLQPASMAGAGHLDGLSGLPSKHPVSEPQGLLGELPRDLLGEIVKRAAGLDGPPQAATPQLASLKAVNKAFYTAASEVQAHREAVIQTVRYAIKDAEDEWSRSGWGPADKERIEARLAGTLRNLDQVIVRLDHIGTPLDSRAPLDWSRRERAPQMVQMVLDVLTAHPGLHSLNVSAENDQLSSLAEMAGKRPELLRSLHVGISAARTYLNEPESLRIAKAVHVRTELGKVLAGQKNLTTLKLQDASGGMSVSIPLDLQLGGLDNAIASLTSLRSLALSHCQMKPDDAAALAEVLRKLPALEELDLSHNTLDAAAVAQIASSLPALPRLRSLNLQGTSLAGASVGHLAHVLRHVAELRALDLGSTKLVAADMEHLAGGLAGLKQLQTLDVSYNRLDQDGRSRLIAALAQVPTLRDLHLRAKWHQKPPNLDTLKDDLRPLAGNHELHVHLQKPNDKKGEESRARLEAEQPRIHFSA